MSTPATPSTNPLPVSADETTPALSEGERLTNVFIAPSKTFTDLKRKAGWFVPWLVLAIVTVAFVGVAGYKVGFRQMMENEMRLNPKAQERISQIPPERRDAAMAVSVTITKVRFFLRPVFLLVVFLIYAAILLATFNFGMGTQVPFGTCLSIVVYAQLPIAIRSLLAIVALLAGADPEGFLIDNPIASNLGYFVDASSHLVLYTLASAVDIFVIWTIVLTGIGFACVTKLKKATTIGTVFAWYALFILIIMGVVAVFT